VRIAICDDEKIIREELKSVLTSIDVFPIEAMVIDCPSGATLIANHVEHPFDIIFLDIEMKGVSGLEAGHMIRNTDRNVIIIFLTSHQQYVFQSFRTEAFDFILKPITKEKISDVFSRALQKYKEQHHIVHIKWMDSTWVIDVSSIVYLESNRRQITFVTKDERYACIGRLSDYESRLVPYGFLRCHQSFLINMNYIKSIENTAITTTYNQDVHMSVRKKQYCLKAFSNFLVKYRV